MLSEREDGDAECFIVHDIFSFKKFALEMDVNHPVLRTARFRKEHEKLVDYVANKRGFAMVDSKIHIQQAEDMLNKKHAETLKMGPDSIPICMTLKSKVIISPIPSNA